MTKYEWFYSHCTIGIVVLYSFCTVTHQKSHPSSHLHTSFSSVNIAPQKKAAHIATSPQIQLVPQPFKATAQSPAELRRIVPYEDIPAVANNIETKRSLAMSHCDTSYRHDWNYVSLGNDPCRWWNWQPASNNLWGELVQWVWISKESRSALVCLNVA